MGLKMKKLIVNADYKLKNAIINLLVFFLFRRISNLDKIKKILIFRTGSIGDNICALPAINSVRQNFKDAEMNVLTNSGGGNLVSLENLIDKNIVDKIINYLGVNKKELFRSLKQSKYDLFIELPQTHATFKTNIRNIIICKMLGIKYAFGWQVYSTRLFKKNQEKYNHFINETLRLTKILKSQNLAVNIEEFPLSLSDYDRNNCDSILASLTVDVSRKNIGIIAGAKRQTNRWPVENYNVVIQYLINKGFNVFLIGGQADSDVIDKIDKHAQIYNFAGLFTPLESAYAMSKCEFVISNDTGPMHLAYSVGSPVIGIFSCRDYPKMWYPPTNGLNTVLRAESIECSICLLESCNNNNNCLKLIEVEDVLKKVDDLIKNLSIEI